MLAMTSKCIMSKISAIILTKNSENLIADCIESVSFCDEIILVDDNSTDRTTDLAKHLGARVVEADPRKSNFSDKRNLGLSKAKNKWILYIDSDERVTRDLKNSILSAISERKQSYTAYKIFRKNFYFGNHEWPYVETFIRLFRKQSLKGWHGELHETPVVDGEIGELNGYLYHYTHSDLTSMVTKTISWSEIEARLRYKANHPAMTWWRFPRVMATAFYDSYIRQKGYKAGTAGLIESIYQAFSIFITYARLWEMQQNKTKKKDL